MTWVALVGGFIVGLAFCCFIGHAYQLGQKDARK
jgi:hypothetical protein